MTDKTEAPELKPCRFCGDKMIVVDADEICCLVEYNAVARCCECDAQGPGAYRHDTQEEAISEAIKLWNTRTDTICAEVKPLVWEELSNGEFRADLIGMLNLRVGQNYKGKWEVSQSAPGYSTLFAPGLFDTAQEAMRFAGVTVQQSLATTRPASEVHQEGYDAGKAAGRAEAAEEAIIWLHDNFSWTEAEMTFQEMTDGLLALINKEAGE